MTNEIYPRELQNRKVNSSDAEIPFLNLVLIVKKSVTPY